MEELTRLIRDATTPRAAAWRFPYASEPGIQQVYAFLYMPEFNATSTRSTSPSVSAFARAAANAIAPGSGWQGACCTGSYGIRDHH